MRLDSKNKAYNKYAEPDNFGNMTSIDKVAGITLLLMAAIIPLIVKFAEVPVGPDQNLFITPNEKSLDMFSYYKSIYILVGSCILLISLFSYIFSERTQSFINWRKLLTSPLSIGFFVFIFTITASSIWSKYKYTVVHGISERYESVFILFCYLVIFAAAVLFVRGAYQCRLLIYGLLFSCLIIGLIGMFQFFKMDFFMTKLASKLVIGLNTTLRLTTPFPNRSYTTLYNPNSVGSYTALMLPITVMGAVCYNRGIAVRVWFIACAVVMLFTAIGCGSAGGLGGLAVSAVVFLIVFVILSYKAGRKAGTKVLLGTIAGLAVIAAIALSFSPIRARLYSIAAKFLFTESDAINYSGNYFLKDLKTADGAITIVTANGDISFTRTPGALLVSAGGDSSLLPVSSQENAQNNSVINNYSVSGLGDFVVEVRTDAFMFKMNNANLLFLINENNSIVPMSRMMNPIDLNKPVDAFGFEGTELWGSGRGYIWSRTLPLLKSRLFIGSGPDTFVLAFPQDDIAGKIKFLGNPYIIVDKAHNLFLQTAVNTGVLSMLALLFILIWFIVTSFFSVIKGAAHNEEKWMFWLRIAILSGICGYAAASLTTDSTVSVSPVFWIALGLGIALQRRLARE